MTDARLQLAFVFFGVELALVACFEGGRVLRQLLMCFITRLSQSVQSGELIAKLYLEAT